MPEDISVRITAQDDLTPVLRQIQDTLRAVGKAGIDAGREIAEVASQLGKGQWTFTDPQQQKNLDAFNRALGDTNKTFSQLFEMRGGLKAWFEDVGEKAFGKGWADPSKVEKFTAAQMQGLEMYRAKVEKNALERERIERESAEQQVKLEEWTDKRQTDLFKSAYIDQVQDYENRLTEARNRGRRALHDIGAEQRRIRAEESEEAGRGGFMGNIERAVGGGFVGRLARDMVWGAESFLRYMIVWKALDTVMQGVGNTIVSTGHEFEAFNKIATQVGATNAFRDLQQINSATFALGVSVEEVTKNFQALYSEGFGEKAAIAGGEFAARTKKLFGIDLIPTMIKASFGQASIQELLATTVAPPFEQLRSQLLGAAREEAMAPIRRTIMQQQEMEESRAMQDRHIRMERYYQDEHILASDRMEDRHRQMQYNMQEEHLAITRNFEDVSRGVQREMEDRFYMRNRDMELAHRGMEREMQDQHILAQRQTEDTERRIAHENTIAGRRMALAESMPGTMDVLAGRVSAKTPAMGFIGAQILGPDFQRGLDEIQKETGVTADQIREAMREGMSPGIVLQFAQAAREEETFARHEKEIAEQRKRETDELSLQRQIQDENFKEADAQHKEAVAVQRYLADTQREINRALQDQQIAITKYIAEEEITQRRKFRNEDLQLQRIAQDEELEMTRRHQDEQVNFEVRLLRLRLDANRIWMQALMEGLSMIQGQVQKFYQGPLGFGAPKPETYTPEQMAPTDEMQDFNDEVQQMTGSMESHRASTDEQDKATRNNTTSLINQIKATNDATTSTNKFAGAVDAANKAVDNFIGNMGRRAPVQAPSEGGGEKGEKEGTTMTHPKKAQFIEGKEVLGTYDLSGETPRETMYRLLHGGGAFREGKITVYPEEVPGWQEKTRGAGERTLSTVASEQTLKETNTRLGAVQELLTKVLSGG